ncbi:hemolymph juvenile hormone binding protein (JHBP) [Popillia japonica]|uniref:Hemolymph juvenile hormone binding protein (JHBP) n=1 Tax=Popillia japonica TaxID=7064 RepID=A0AAW1IDB9_POPJA
MGKQFSETVNTIKMLQKITFLVVALASLSYASKLPPYITACKRDPATLTDCATKEARKILPQFLNGDPSLKVPKLNPLKLPSVDINPGNDLTLKLTEVIINGFEDHVIDLVAVDLNKHHITIKMEFPRLNLISKYDINGQLLVLPIRGSGPANITFVGSKFNFDSDFEEATRGGETYLHLKDYKLSYTTERIYVHLDNLFDGDSVLGPQVNKFLDENWMEVDKELGPSIVKVINFVIKSIVDGVFNSIPMNQIFLP